MKKSEIYKKAITVMVLWNEALDWEDNFPVLRQLFSDYESAVCAEEWEAKHNKEGYAAPDTASTVLFTEVDG